MNNELKLSDLDIKVKQDEGVTLIATFYFYNGIPASPEETHTYYERLLKHMADHLKQFGIKMKQEPAIDGWMMEKTDLFNYSFVRHVKEIVGLRDTSAIMVGSTTFLPINTGWITLKTHLEQLLKSWKDEILDGANQKAWKFLGSTLLHKTNIKNGVLYKNKAIGKIADYAQPIYSARRSETIAQHEFNRGMLFLTGLPLNVGFDQAITYILLAETGHGSNLINDLFFENNGKMLTINGYTLKSTYEWSQLKSKKYMDYSSNITKLAADAEALIDKAIRNTNSTEVFNLLKPIAHNYHQYTSQHSMHERLFLSISIQHQNLIERIKASIEPIGIANNIFDALERRLRIQDAEAQTINRRSQIIFKLVQNAISITETLNKTIVDDRNYKTQLILTLAGIGLAFVQIFDNECAVGFLKVLHIIPGTQTEPSTQWWIKLLTKLTVGCLLLLFAFLIMKPRKIKSV